MESRRKSTTYKVVIPGRLAGLNELLSHTNSSRYMGARLKREQDDLISVCLGPTARRLNGRKLTNLYIKFCWYEKNKRRDKDNIASAKKYILDAMQKTGIIDNDGWEQIEGWEDFFAVDADNPRVELMIMED